MYVKISIGLLIVGLLYGLSQLPDYFYQKGYKQGINDSELAISRAAEKAKRDNELEVAKIKLANETKLREQSHEYNINLKKLESDYQRKLANGLLFNKNRICAGYNGTSTKGESSQGTDEGTSSTGILPEPYSKDLIELMYEMEQISLNLRALQKVINTSSCMEVVSDNKE